MPDLIKIGLAHAQFETIHPVLDGNGRLGRLLITFLLCEKQIMQRPLLYISYFFKKYRAEYYDRIQAIRNSGNWEDWLKFFLRGVSEVAQEASGVARKIVSLREEHRQLVLERMKRKSGTAIALLEQLYFRPIITVENVQEITGLSSYGNANDLVKDLCDLGLLAETTGQKRNRVFAYSPYLDVFKD